MVKSEIINLKGIDLKKWITDYFAFASKSFEAEGKLSYVEFVSLTCEFVSKNLNDDCKLKIRKND